MTTDRLIWPVVLLTVIVILAIVALAIWRPGDNTVLIGTILGVAGPTISVLIVLLQGQRTEKKVEEVKQEAKQVVHVVEQTQKTALKAEAAATRVESAREATAAKVDEIRDLVNGRNQELVRENIELKERLRQQNQ